jgi:transposase, IS6 family
LQSYPIAERAPVPRPSRRHCRWCFLNRATDQFGQVIDVLLSAKRDAKAARRFLADASTKAPRPAEVTTDRAPVYPLVLDEVMPDACPGVERYANNSVEADHGRLKARLRPMRGLKRIRTSAVVVAGHDFVQNLRRGHYELGVDLPTRDRVAAPSPN